MAKLICFAYHPLCVCVCMYVYIYIYIYITSLRQQQALFIVKLWTPAETVGFGKTIWKVTFQKFCETKWFWLSERKLYLQTHLPIFFHAMVALYFSLIQFLSNEVWEPLSYVANLPCRILELHSKRKRGKLLLSFQKELPDVFRNTSGIRMNWWLLFCLCKKEKKSLLSCQFGISCFTLNRITFS